MSESFTSSAQISQYFYNLKSERIFGEFGENILFKKALYLESFWEKFNSINLR